MGGRPNSGSVTETPFLRRAGLYIAVGFEVPSTILGGVLVGYVLDNYFATSPWLLISVTLIAFVGASVRLVRWARFFSKRRHDGNNANNNPAY
jgi:F0F1-type ATP synthase assembly protein I